VPFGMPWVSACSSDARIATIPCQWGDNVLTLPTDTISLELGWSPLNWSDEATVRHVAIPLPPGSIVEYKVALLPYRAGRVKLIREKDAI
jgi:hypothetical protein